MTNFEKIMNGGADGLARTLANIRDCCEYCNYDKLSCRRDCVNGIKEWLESEPKRTAYIVMDEGTLKSGWEQFDAEFEQLRLERIKNLEEAFTRIFNSDEILESEAEYYE